MSIAPSILVSPSSKQLNGQSRQVPNLGNIHGSQDIQHVISNRLENETLNNSPNFTQDQASRFADAYGTLNDRNEETRQQ